MTHAPARAFVALGGNLGDVPAAFAGALEALAELAGTRVRARSSLYRNPPLVAAGQDAGAQPEFVNAVAELETTLSAQQLLDALLAIERRFGRERLADQRWAPRTLDLDLLLYDDARIDAPGLCVPHPALHERAFVLVPLAELDPRLLIPGRGPVRALLEAVDSSAVEALP